MTLRTLSAALGVWFTASLIAPPMSVSAQQVTLRWKWVPGSELVYRVTNRTEATNPMMGGTSVTEETHTMRWSVSEVAPNGDATVTVTTESAQLEMSGPMGNVSYDSRTDETPTNPQAQMAAAITGLSFTLVLSPEGMVKSVQGTEQLVEAMIGAMPPESLAMVEDMLREMFSEELVIGSMQKNIQGFTEEPVGPGGSWQQSFGMTIPMMGAATTTQTFTVDGIEEREGRTVAVISMTGEMVMGEEADGPLAGMMEMGDSEITGTVNFDVDRGLTLSSTGTSNIEITVSMGDQQMAVGTLITTTLELIDYVSPSGLSGYGLNP